jgi:hypothetical protein
VQCEVGYRIQLRLVGCRALDEIRCIAPLQQTWS